MPRLSIPARANGDASSLAGRRPAVRRRESGTAAPLWTKLATRTGGPAVLQRKCACEGSGAPCPACEEEDGRPSLIQRQAAEPSAPAASPAALLTEDGAATLGPGQMRKSEFLSEARAAVCAAIEAVVAAAGLSTDECPYLGGVFFILQRRSAASIEATIRAFSPELAAAASARASIPAIAARAAQAAREWVSTGRVTGLPESLPSFARFLSGGDTAAEAPLQPKAGPGGAVPSHPRAVQARLGAGRPLDPASAARMGATFGADFSHVRVHADAEAGRLSRGLNATAFTIANHVAFGEGAYRPGTPLGDALLAHELAHVIQQGGRESADGVLPRQESSSSSALEADADQSAATAVASLWGRTRESLSGLARSAAPRLTAGLRLSRCGDTEKKKPARSVMAPMILEWQKAGLLDPPARPPEVGEFPPLELSNEEQLAELGIGAAAGLAVPKTAPAPVEPAPARPQLRVVPPEPAPPTAPTPGPTTGPRPIVVPAPAVAVGVGIIVFLWPRSTAEPFYDTMNPVTGKPWVSRDDYRWVNRLTPEQIDYLKQLQKTNPVPAPTPKAVPAPQPKPKEEEKKRKDCRMTPRAVPRGGDPLSTEFCDLVGSGAPSVDIWSTAGSAEIDALVGSTWYECKCGHLSLVRAHRRGRRWTRFALDRLDEEIRRHMRIAAHCRLRYRVVVANERVAEFFRDRYPDLNVVVVEFDPCEQ